MKKRVLERALRFHQQYLQQVDDPPRKAELGSIAFSLGIVQFQAAEFEAAERNLQTAIDTFDAILAGQPDNQDAMDRLTWALQNQATLHLYRGHSVTNMPRQAESECLRCAGLLTTLIAQVPEERLFQIRLVQCLLNQSGVEQQLGRDWEPPLREADRQITRIISEFVQLVATDWEVIALCHKQYSQCLLQDGRNDEALQYAGKAFDAAEKIATDFPEHEQLQETFSLCAANLASVLDARNDFAGSEKLERRVIENLRALTRRDPANAFWHHLLGGSLNNLGRALGMQNRWEEAIACLNEAIEEQRLALGVYPNNLQFNTYISNHYHLLAWVHSEVGDWRKCAGSANQLSTIPKPDGNNHYRAAIWLCMASTLAKDDRELSDAQRQDLEQRYRSESLEQLRLAVGEGFADPQKLKERPFDVWLDAPDFQAFLAEIGGN
jgi:tetratricopeptide (TPR) repeat protein